MMRRGSVALAVLFLLALPAAGRAGLYDPGAPVSRFALDPPYRQVGRPAAYERVKDWLGDLSSIDDAAPKLVNGVWDPYQKYTDALEKRRREVGLTTAEAVSLGGGLLRRGRWERAMAVLQEAQARAAGDPGRFLLQLNLATAYDRSNNPELRVRAIDTQRQALASWPAVWAGWGREEMDWYRRVETFALTLMQYRANERPPSFGEGPTLYPLFAGVGWVGPSGEYEAGALKFDQWNKLPVDAEQIVLQLLLWDPMDARLRWLYGELLNARGQVPAAEDVLYQCISTLGLSGSRVLMRHRTVLLHARPVYEQLAKTPPEQTLWLVTARGLPVPAGVGTAVADAAWPAAVGVQRQPSLPAPPAVGPQSSGTGTDGTRPGPVLPDWRVLLVGFAAGGFATLLLVFQWQQLRRRRSLAR
jgi:hypothetical protein